MVIVMMLMPIKLLVNFIFFFENTKNIFEIYYHNEKRRKFFALTRRKNFGKNTPILLIYFFSGNEINNNVCSGDFKIN